MKKEKLTKFKLPMTPSTRTGNDKQQIIFAIEAALETIGLDPGIALSWVILTLPTFSINNNRKEMRKR